MQAHRWLLCRWQKDPEVQQPVTAARHMASAPHAVVPPHAWPTGIFLGPVQESNAADGWHAHLDLSRLWHIQPAGQQVPWNCPSRAAKLLVALATETAVAGGGDIPPH
jgi:hypothetical protein